MAEVLVLVDHTDGEVKKVTFELLTVAREIGEPSAVVVGAPGTASKLTEQLGAYGAEKVYVAESDDAAGYLVTPQVDVLASLVGSASPAAVLVSASADGKEISGRLAARIGGGLLYDVIGVDEVGLASAWSTVTEAAPKPPREAGQRVEDEGDGGVKVAEYLVSQKLI